MRKKIIKNLIDELILNIIDNQNTKLKEDIFVETKDEIKHEIDETKHQINETKINNLSSSESQDSSSESNTSDYNEFQNIKKKYKRKKEEKKKKKNNNNKIIITEDDTELLNQLIKNNIKINEELKNKNKSIRFHKHAELVRKMVKS